MFETSCWVPVDLERADADLADLDLADLDLADPVHGDVRAVDCDAVVDDLGPRAARQVMLAWAAVEADQLAWRSERRAVEDAVVAGLEAVDAIADLEATAVLAKAAAGQRAVNLAQAEQLAVAARWADLHAKLERPTPVRGGETLVRPGGEGTPSLGEFCRVELAAVIGVSQTTAGNLMADALDLRHRLPLLWARVRVGEVKVWVARKIAVRTRHLTQQACARVDRRLAPIADGVVYARLEKALDAAILRADPVQAAEDTETAAAQQGVWVGRETDHGHGTIFGKAAMPDIHAVDLSLNTLARALTVLGDTDSHDLRRAKALGILADPAAALELTRLAAEALTASESAGTPRGHEGGNPRRGCDLGPATLYVHITGQALADAGGMNDRVARVEGVGPVLLDQVRGWLRHRHVKLTQVIDIPGMASVDAYEVPAAMAEAIRLRTPADCAPYSPNTGRDGDQDHTIPYTPMDDGGPPGQTSVANLARMTRFNHRWKTHGAWKVTQPRSGVWVWRSPHGYFFLVDHTGTTPLRTL